MDCLVVIILIILSATWVIGGIYLYAIHNIWGLILLIAYFVFLLIGIIVTKTAK